VSLPFCSCFVPFFNYSGWSLFCKKSNGYATKVINSTIEKSVDISASISAHVIKELG